MDKNKLRQEIKDVIASYADDYGLSNKQGEEFADYCGYDIMKLVDKLDKEVN